MVSTPLTSTDIGVAQALDQAASIQLGLATALNAHHF